MLTRFCAIVAFALLAVLCCAGRARAGLNGCMVGKLGCVTRKTTCLFTVEAAARLSGTAPDVGKLQRCRDLFGGGGDPAASCFAKVEAANECFEQSGPASHESDVDDFVADVVGLLDPNPANDANHCTAGKIRCVRTKTKCILDATRRVYRSGFGRQEWFDRCRNQFDGGGDATRSCFAVRERDGTCLTSGDVATLETRVDDFQHEELCLFSALSDCPTPTPTPTPTLTPTPPTLP